MAQGGAGVCEMGVSVTVSTVNIKLKKVLLILMVVDQLLYTAFCLSKLQYPQNNSGLLKHRDINQSLKLIIMGLMLIFRSNFQSTKTKMTCLPKRSQTFLHVHSSLRYLAI